MTRLLCFVVEQGSYSDYRVVGVFSSRANAKLIADRINEHGGEEATIAEWPMNPAVEELNAGLAQFNVVMVADGTTERCEQRQVSGYNLAGEVEHWKRTSAPAYRGKGIPDAIVATVWAEDEKHAIKIVNEVRAQWVESGKLR